MDHSGAAGSLRRKWPTASDVIHLHAQHLSNVSRLSSRERRRSRTREAGTLVCSPNTISAMRFGTRRYPTTRQSRRTRHVVKRAMCGTRHTSRPFQEHMKGVLGEAGYAALKVCHQVYYCLEADLAAAIHGDDIIAEGEPTEALGRGQCAWQDRTRSSGARPVTEEAHRLH